MPSIYQRDPYRSDLTGSIAGLMQDQGRQAADHARQVADIQARAIQQQGQTRGNLFMGLGQLAQNTIGDIMQARQREREQAPRREMEQLQLDAARRDSDAERETVYNTRKAGEAVQSGVSMDELPPQVRQIAEGYQMERQKFEQAQQEFWMKGRKMKAAVLRNYGYDPQAAAQMNGDGDAEWDRQIQAAGGDTAKLRQLASVFLGPEPAPTYSQTDSTKDTYKTNPDGTRELVSAGVPEVKPDTRSLDVQIAEAATSGNRGRYNQLLSAKRAIEAAGRDPNASIVSKEPLVAVIGDDGQPVLMERSKAAGRRPASNREQGRPVTAGSAAKLAELQTSLDDTAKLRSVLGTTGAESKLGAALPNFVTEFTGWGTDSKSRQGTIDRVKQVIGKALEGGVLRKEDEYKYTKILPTIGDPPAVAKAKLDGLDAALKLRMQREVEALSDAGYDVAAFEKRQTQAAAPPSVVTPKAGSKVGRFEIIEVK